MMETSAMLATAVAATATGFSLRWNWWRFPKKGIPVLMYHKVGTPVPESRQKSLWVSEERFDWQMEYLAQQGYQSVTFDDLAKSQVPKNPVMITFDDGYLNQYGSAFPIMKRHGMRGIFYIVSEAIGKDNYWHDPKEEPRIPMMTLDHIKEMRRGGMEIGSHAMNHQRLAHISFDEAKKEIWHSKTKLEQLLGEPMLSFAFPYGNGEDVPTLVQTSLDAGYRWVVGIHSGIWNHHGEDRVVCRVFVRGDDWKIDFPLQLTRGKSRV